MPSWSQPTKKFASDWRILRIEPEDDLMSSVITDSASGDRESKPRGPRLHPLGVRIMHWINAVAMLIMITSGWGIYDDYVIFHGTHFSSSLRLGSWAAPSLLWHFAAMWLLVLNGLAYLVYGIASGRLHRRLLPIGWHDLIQTLVDSLHFRIAHEDLTVYNAVQKLLYIIVILAGIWQVLTGLLIWKPVQFSSEVALLGGFQAVRLEHFIGMSVIVGFLLVHVALSLLVPSTLWAMIGGGPRVEGTAVRR
jgi:thiosulfate reductase cytochrome b subunit